jgi:hypothetical protein
LEDFDNDGWKDLFVAQSHVLETMFSKSTPLCVTRSCRCGAESGAARGERRSHTGIGAFEMAVMIQRQH